MTRWWFSTFGQELGPLSIDELIDLARRGVLTRSDKIRLEGASWQPAESVGELSQVWSNELPRVDAAATAEDDRSGRLAATSGIAATPGQQRGTASTTAADALQKMLEAATRGKGVRRGADKHSAEANCQPIEIAADQERPADLGPPIDIDLILAEAKAPPGIRAEREIVRAGSAPTAARKRKRPVAPLGLLELVVFASGALLGFQLFPGVFWSIIATLDVRGWSWSGFAVWNVVVVVLLMATRWLGNNS